MSNPSATNHVCHTMPTLIKILFPMYKSIKFMTSQNVTRVDTGFDDSISK